MMEGWPEVDDFVKDADMEGRSLNSFMKDVSTWASVFGHCWIMVTKPNLGFATRAEEMAAGIRPYVSMLTPMNVLDWHVNKLTLLAVAPWLVVVNGLVLGVKFAV